MDKQQALEDLSALDDKLREMETESRDFVGDMIERLRNAREHINDIRDQIKEKNEPTL